MTAEVTVLHPSGMVDLAPEIYRQRLVIEGLVTEPISAEQIERYLSELSGVLEMTTLLHPVTHQSDTYGWAGWIHWETSGAHFYGWDQPRLFFSVDIYTCKAFSADRAVQFTRDFFAATTVVSREF
jgi:S-adenosylmethionine decarboxylase